MTGKELIVYILLNNLENKEVLGDGVFLDLVDENEVAIKYNVGIATVRAWHQQGLLKGTKIGNSIYFLRDTIYPKNSEEKHNE